MFPKATILYSGKLDIIDRNLKKLIKFMGIECEVFSVEQFITNQKELLNEKNLCLLASKETMSNLIRVLNKTDNSILTLMNKLHSMLVYALAPSQSSCEVLKLLTGGVVSSVSQFEYNKYQYKVSGNHKNICGTFTGLSFGPINRDIDFGFDVKYDCDYIVPLILIEDKGFFIKIKKSNCNLFLIACNDIIDIDQKITGEFNVKMFFFSNCPNNNVSKVYLSRFVLE